MHVFDKILIDGQWVAPGEPGHFDIVNPATEEVCGRIPNSGAADVDRAVAAARAALVDWKLTPAAERGRALAAIADEMDARAAELGAVIVEELGSPAAMTAQYMVGFPASTIRFYADLLLNDGFPFEEKIGNSLVVREPKGVVAMITPWNYPIHQITAKVGPALAAGCTVVVKPTGNNSTAPVPTGPYNWRWPASGTVLRGFALPASKGLDITDKLGAPVYAAAPGRVVYSGSALKGYGELIIVKHDETYLSAYGYNRRRLVEEGDAVTGGQQIGEIGMGPESRPVLHFEIRRAGQPVNPSALLPAR